MMRPRRGTPRRGYSMMLVVLFLIIMMSMIGATYRQVGSVLRIEAAHTRQILRDEGALLAAARGVKMLEDGPPPTNPYVVNLGITTSAGSRTYQLTFTSDPSGTNRWTLEVIPAPSTP